MKRILLRILATVGVAILLVVIALFLFGYFLNKKLEPKINPALYVEIVQNRMEQSDQYMFLPETIPQDAIKVAFFHIPGFLQGGDVIALRMILPPDKITSLLKELEGSGRTEIPSFEGISAPNAYPAYGMKKPGSKNLFEGMSELPNDFRIFLYKSDIRNIQENWNHNILSFTAISTNRNEVVYFIDSW